MHSEVAAPCGQLHLQSYLTPVSVHLIILDTDCVLLKMYFFIIIGFINYKNKFYL